MSTSGRNGTIRVVIAQGQLAQGGSERQLYNLLLHCDRSVFSPTLVVSGALGHWEQPIAALGIPIHLLHGSRARKMLQMRKICGRLDADVLFSWEAYTNMYGFAVAGSGCKRIGSYRDRRPENPRGLQRLVEWAQLRATRTIVCNGRELYEDLEADLGRSQELVYVPNGVDPIDDPERHRRAWRTKLGLSDEDRLVVGVGRLAPQKNFPRFIETVRLINKELPCTGVIAGPDKGEAQRLTTLIDNLDLPEGRVRLLGAVPDARELICAADVLLLSSNHEGMPNVLMEAMSVGVPCVTTPVSGVRALIDDGRHGIIGDFEPGTLAEGAIRLLSDTELAGSVSAAAQDRIRREFLPEMAAETLWALCGTTPTDDRPEE